MWVDQAGGPESVVASGTDTTTVRLSPDGRRAVSPQTLGGTNRDLWLYDLERTTRTRLTSDPGLDRSPVWLPDGSGLLFASSRGAIEAIYQISATGATSEHIVLEADPGQSVIPLDVSADGRVLVYARGAGAYDLWILLLDGSRQPAPYLTTPFDEGQAALSADGRWLLYLSNETGQYEVILQSFPDPADGKWTVSTNGGANPRWRSDGRELYYRDLSDRIAAVPFGPGRPPVLGQPVPLFALPVGLPQNRIATGSAFQFDVNPDGQRFPVAAPLEAADRLLTVTLNWK